MLFSINLDNIHHSIRTEPEFNDLKLLGLHKIRVALSDETVHLFLGKTRLDNTDIDE